MVARSFVTELLQQPLIAGFILQPLVLPPPNWPALFHRILSEASLPLEWTEPLVDLREYLLPDINGWYQTKHSVTLVCLSTIVVFAKAAVPLIMVRAR